MASGYGYDFKWGHKIFNEDRIRLGPVTHMFNPSFTSALVGYLEGTFHDDNVKNGFLYFPCGDEFRDARAEQFIVYLIAQFRNSKNLLNYKPAMRFAMQSRTNQEAPMHHGGLRLLFWAAFGPLGLKKKGDRSNLVAYLAEATGAPSPIPEGGRA